MIVPGIAIGCFIFGSIGVFVYAKWATNRFVRSHPELFTLDDIFQKYGYDNFKDGSSNL